MGLNYKINKMSRIINQGFFLSQDLGEIVIFLVYIFVLIPSEIVCDLLIC